MILWCMVAIIRRDTQLPHAAVHVALPERASRVAWQERSPDESDDFNQLVQGVVIISIREANSNMPDEPPEADASDGQVTVCN